MIIGIDTSASGSKYTGTGRYIDCFLEQLKYFDNEVKIFPHPVKADELNSENKEAIFNKKFRGIKEISVFGKKHYYRLFGLSAEMKNAKADCGIFPNYFIPFNFSKPAAIVIHDLSFITRPEFYSKKFVIYYKYLLKKTLKKNPVVITISEHTKRNIIKFLNIKEEDIFLLQGYPNIKTKMPVAEELAQSIEPYFLYVGHIEPRKNLQFLIENFLKWKYESNIKIKLRIVGEVWVKSKEIKLLLKKYKNHPDIIFEGYVTERSLDSIYRNAFGFVHTSLEEGFGFPVLEAMSYNLPVLCSGNHATEEISSPFSITINPDNDRSLIEGLERLYKKKINNHIPGYDIKYSPGFMRNQLSIVLDILHSKVNKKIIFIQNKSISSEEAIEKTLLYSHLFNGGLKKNELYRFLFDVKLNQNQFDEALSNLEKLNKISLKKDNIKLKYHNINIYNKSPEKLDKKTIKKSLRIINHIPFISCACYSGGSANYGIENHNDIDLFLIAKPNSVYLVYLLIHFFSKILNLRDHLCANFLIDETRLEIKGKRDYYTAHQIASLVPFRNSFMLERFRKNNPWVADFFPNFNLPLRDDNPGIKKFKNIYTILKPLNILLKNFYRLLYRKHLHKDSSGAIKLENGCIKLYTNDHRIKILEAFNREWKAYLKIKGLNTVKTKKFKIKEHVI